MRACRALVVVVALLGMCCAVSALDPASLLDQAMPEPPRRNSRLQQMRSAATATAVAAEPHSLLAVSTQTHVSASAALSAQARAEAALAMDESIVASAAVEDTVTERGQLSAEEQALVERQIAIPHTRIPSDPAKPVQYVTPALRDKLTKEPGPLGYPYPEKLEMALTTLKTAAEFRIGQINRHAKWQKAAEKLVGELGGKKHAVLQHVEKLTAEIKDLLGKKKQIQNKQLQDKLVGRLSKTQSNLKRVRQQTHNIRKNQADMLHHKEELAHALEGIKRSLAVLKGFKRQRQFPFRGAAARMQDDLSKYDPELSNEKEDMEIQKLTFPDQVLTEVEAGADVEAGDME